MIQFTLTIPQLIAYIDKDSIQFTLTTPQLIAYIDNDSIYTDDTTIDSLHW